MIFNYRDFITKKSLILDQIRFFEAEVKISELQELWLYFGKN